MAKHISLALDWTPNTIHTGFYVAAAKGFYDDFNLKVEFLLPDTDAYAVSPAKKVELGLADLALAPSESVISFRIKAQPTPLVAVAAVLAKDASAVVTLKSSGIERPAQLDGKVYASYNARFEDHIVKQLVRNDGGRGEVRVIYPERLGVWSTLVNGEADATWIFLPWEGMDARLRGLELNVFQLGDYGIPYGYSPVIVGHQEFVQKKKVRKFLRATAKGFAFAKSNPLEAAEILMQAAAHPSLADRGLVEQSQVYITQYYFDENGNWGVMQNKVWVDFINWLVQEGILTDHTGQVITNINPYAFFSNDWIEN